MGLSFKVSDKELLSAKNRIFIETGIPELEKNGFSESPFFGHLFGKNNLNDFTYEMCRLSNLSILEIITTHISRGDKYIKIYLNIFRLHPQLHSLSLLNEKDGMNFGLPPNSLTNMRLRSDDYKGPPLIYILFCPEHKIGSFSTEKGFNRELSKLRELIKKDMLNIDSFVRRWYELYQINQTDWEGNVIKV